MPKSKEFSDQALRRCAPHQTHHNDINKIFSHPKNNIEKRKNQTKKSSEIEQSNDSQDEFTINQLRAILKRPSAKKGTQTKRVTFNTIISYNEPNSHTHDEPPTDDEEDTQQHDKTIHSEDDEDESHINQENDIASWIKTIEATASKIETSNNHDDYIMAEYANIPSTHTQEDIDMIPDTVDANNINSNLNDAQLPYLNAVYGIPLLDQIRQPSLIDTGASFTFMHTSIFKRLPSRTRYINSKKPLKIRTAKGEVLQDEAIIALIPMTFKDRSNNYHTIKTLFLVVNVISPEVFLGNDLLLRCNTFTNINKHTIHYIDHKTKTKFTIPITWIKSYQHLKYIHHSLHPPLRNWFKEITNIRITFRIFST